MKWLLWTGSMQDISKIHTWQMWVEKRLGNIAVSAALSAALWYASKPKQVQAKPSTQPNGDYTANMMISQCSSLQSFLNWNTNLECRKLFKFPLPLTVSNSPVFGLHSDMTVNYIKGKHAQTWSLLHYISFLFVYIMMFKTNFGYLWHINAGACANRGWFPHYVWYQQ